MKFILSSVPEWDSDVCEDGELVYIKTKAADATTSKIKSAKTPLLENCEAFKLRNDFKRSSTRRSSKGNHYIIVLSVPICMKKWHSLHLILDVSVPN